MINEITIYEVRNNKQKEFESLMGEIRKYYHSEGGVESVKVIRHIQAKTDFNRVIKESDPEKKPHIVGKVVYVSTLEVETLELQSRFSKSILEQFGKEFMKCLIAPPKIIIGETV